MDSSFTLVKPSSVSSALTVAHLIRNIEQLKNKDKLISQLEKDLGRQSWGAAAHFAVLERRRSEGNPIPPGGIDLSPPFRTLPEGSDDPDAFLWTPTSIQTPGDVEDVWTNVTEGNTSGKHSLPNSLKGSKDRNKVLVEKCRSFLQQNKELTAQNRAFKESSERACQDTKNAHELLEHSKMQLLQMSRQLSQLEAGRSEWEQQMMSVDSLRQELMEDKKMINALRKACSDKDRRIELIQHRKKRRRMLESAEKAKIQNAGLKETPFGYEEDDRQGDGNQSVCSISSTISDDSIWDDVLTSEEMERNYQRLMLEQLELQKSHALLQRQTDSCQDPQRENLNKSDLQNELFLSQCRIEQLEYFIREALQGRNEDLWMEREKIQDQNKHLNSMVKDLKKENMRLQTELTTVQDRNEDMEFRLIELEQYRGENTDGKDPVPSCQDTTNTNQVTPSTSDASTEPHPPDKTTEHDIIIEEAANARKEKNQVMEQLAKELNALLKGKGKDAESALKKLDGFIDKEKALESMAHDLQVKVISLQQEKNSLQDRLLLVEQSLPGKGGTSASLAQAKERQENLALKAAIESESRLVSERIQMQEQIEDLETQNKALKQEIEILTHQQQMKEVKEDVVRQQNHPNLQSSVNNDGSGSTKISPLSRKSSDRKSKYRDGTDPTTSKRRKSSPENESDDSQESIVKECNSGVYSKPEYDCKMSDEESGTMSDNQGEENVHKKMHRLQRELSKVKNCNDDLIMQLHESVKKKLELESNHQSMQDKILSMEQGLDLLHKENVALGGQLRQRVEEFQITQDERNPRIFELEEFCEDLQERLKEAENCERLLREKLKLFEKSIEEAELQEMTVRERCEQLLAGDFEAKKQIQDLQRTGLELRDIVLEKEIVEQALRDKVDFLQKAEAASVQRIEELESIVKDLRQQLEDKSNGKSLSPRDAHKMTEMKHQMTFLETDNKALSARVAELEENEETLRENWRRVAEEDYNRTQCLEEKVKMLESLNRDLKGKLKDAQEYYVIDTSGANISLAAELAESESKLFDDSSDDNADDSEMEGVDSPMKDGSVESDKKAIRERVRMLERQLSEVSEQKNTKIESLQDQLVDHRETQIKLSETISEMEMTERELRAKLALYESSEVTVEKMLKYQSKIEELRTSQESLLDQLEIKENQEMTLQEKMQEMERTLRGKIVTLEVEMKGYKQKELKNAGQIRELEKQESELSEKVAQQAEKENGLYVKISSLMDDLKTSQADLHNVRKQMEDKEDKVRQAKLLEVKLLEIEMECAKKVSTVNAKLRHKEEEFRQKESAYEEKISTLEDAAEHKSKLEDEFARKELDIQNVKSEKEAEVSKLLSQISELQKNSCDITAKVSSLEKDLQNEKEKVLEKETLIQNLKEEIELNVQEFERLISEKETEKGTLEAEIRLKESCVFKLEEELKEANRYLEDFENEKKIKQNEAQVIILKLKSLSDKKISEMEGMISLKLSTLETKLKTMQSHICDLGDYISDLEREKEEQRTMYEECLIRIEKEKDVMESDLRDKIFNLNSQMEEEMSEKESEQSNLLKESQEREASLCFDLSNMQHQVEQHKRELISKLSELEEKNKAHCEVSLDLSKIRHEYKLLQKELDKSKQTYSDMKSSLKTTIAQKENQLSQVEKDNGHLNEIIEDLKTELKDKDQVIDRISTENESVISKNNEENEKLSEEKLDVEKQLTERCQELDKISKLHLEAEKELVELRQMVCDKDFVIQKHEEEKGEKDIKLKEKESHVQSVEVDRESLTQELHSAKTVLESAQNQIGRQQQELQILHTQLQNYQEDNKQFESMIKEQEEKLQEKDQLYEKTSTELKKIQEELQNRDQKLEQADSKVADVESKLQKAENRVRELEAMQVSLEMRLEERYAVSQNAEKVLRSKELQCTEMESKLALAEKNLTNLKDQISFGDKSNEELSQRLQAKENELEMKESEMKLLKQDLEERKVNLELNYEAMKKELTADRERLEKDILEKESMIKSMESNVKESDSDLVNTRSELLSANKALEEKEKCFNDYENQVTSLQENNKFLKCKNENLELELQKAIQQLDQKSLNFEELQKQANEKDTDLTHCKEQLTKSSEELSSLLLKLEETEKILSAKIAAFDTLSEENQLLAQRVEKLSSDNHSVSSMQEHLNQELQSMKDKNQDEISKIESEKSDLTLVNELLRKENSTLQIQFEAKERELKIANEHNTKITENNDNAQMLLSQTQGENKELLAKITSLESELSKSMSEKENAMQETKSLEMEMDQVKAENSQLQREIEEAAVEFQSLTISFEESKTNIENKVQEISEGKQQVEENFQALQKKFSNHSSEMTKAVQQKDEEIEELKTKCSSLTQNNMTLVSDVDSLKCELNEARNMSKPIQSEVGVVVEDVMVCESAVKANTAPTLLSTPPHAAGSMSNENEQTKTDLETSLNEMKDKEKQLQKRVGDLETVEKELREQIVDIEMTVIVPLENENQDLKDEISMVRQERDEAFSKISRWDDENDDDSERRIQESEKLHQRLEDALIYGEELDKKNEILLNDIQKLENENGKLQGRIADLEVTDSERKDEIENLQGELQKLYDNHQDASVLEETETTLMDKVLDLEERERNLIQELESVKKTVTDLNETDNVMEKMKYLEQKNQILADAEGKYMDKIMELEEDKHRLLSKLSSFTDTPVSQSHHIPHTVVNKDLMSIATQTSVPFETNIVAGAIDSSDSVDSQYHSDSLSSSGQISLSSKDESVQKLTILENQLMESKVKLDALDSQLREKETVVLYLQDKLELLQESEGKLMDKLLEAEEQASAIVHSEYSAQIAELNGKIEQIQEENEFLAENVEQYKKSVKEEKEKCNNLQDRLMEDSANLSELQNTREELMRTQQMVEDIQSEYEDQLSERLENESRLKEELSVVVEKHNRLEQVVDSKTRQEVELRDEVDSQRTTIDELRSRLSLVKTVGEDSNMSDSGVSADDPRNRTNPSVYKEAVVVEEPITHRSVKTVLLAKPPTKNTQTSQDVENPDPVPLPRIKRKLRLSSIEKIPHEELVFLVENLQERDAALKKRISDLQAIEDSDLSQKVSQLEHENSQLKGRLRHVEQESAASLLTLPSDSAGGTTKTKERLHRNQISTSTTSSHTSSAMLEKPEDVLNQRIKELEGLDKHNKNMVSELERDREVLHEIARKDKATIHDLNVKIRELQLSERSLKEQVTSLEVSENSYFTKCEELETLRVQLEDRVHELEIHERRLRELVRKLKLDEERWLSKSDGMENAVAELSANETQLKRIVQDMEMEKGGLSERAEYLEARIRELESVEVALLARIKDYENNEVILQNRLVQLENAEAAAHSRASELDVINVNLAQQHKKMVDENAVMTQHLAQLHGQVQDLDRRLMSSRDSEIAYKQHVESLQKNESLLQKKVREYELREIDSQSAIRELEQTVEINNDKMSALQRSENRLRYRVQELEGVGGPIPGEFTPSQHQKVPQKIEDCQKRIVLLQTQVENLKLQLRQALNTTQQQPANKFDEEEDKEDNTTSNVSISKDEYSQLHVKAALLDEYVYQNEELESSVEQLRDTILQLRQGKGACGHEVEIEVYKRRIESLQTFISKLKSSLSEGQTTSLLGSELDSGPQGETLPARHLQVLESERVLQSVRGLHHNGKAESATTSNGGTGLALVEDSMIQATVVQNMAALPSSSASEETLNDQQPEQPVRLEESHWRAIEARKPVTNSTANDSRGGVAVAYRRGTTTPVSSPRHNGTQRSSSPEIEEVTGILNLHSESELSNYQRTTVNDTDESCSSPIPPPRKSRANRLSKNMSDDNNSKDGSGSDRDHHHHHQSNRNKAANQKHFGDDKSLPLTATNIAKQQSLQQHSTPVPLSRFAEDSFYLPSSTQEGVDSLDDDDDYPPPLPSQGPPGQDMATVSGRSSRASSTNMPDGRKESLDNSTSGLSIRERIALIERHLQSDTHTGSHSNREEEDQLFYWKRKSTESLRQVETLDKNNKFLKEDINRLEKELEEKRRYINTLELWLSSTENLLKNKNKQTDREMVEQLQLDLAKLRKELTQSGYRSEDALLDPAALKTELEHRDKEITTKRHEIEALAQELRRCHKECRSIEGMRRTALDSLRSLEKEVVHLQDTEEKLKKSQAEINALKVKYDELDQFKNQALAMVQPLQIKVDRLSKKCREKDILIRRLGAELRRGIVRPSSVLDELTRLERAMNGEEYNTDNSDSYSDDLSPRPSHHKLRGRSVSLDELSIYSDTDISHMPVGPSHSPQKRQRPTPYVNSRPRSADATGSNNRSPRRAQDTSQSSHKPSLHHRIRGFDLSQDHFVAIADYDPGLYSQSGRPSLELILREGDKVKVTGPMDRLGYCEAECNGRVGLVPANYLQPVHHSGMNGHVNPSSPRGPHQSHSIIHLDHSSIAHPPPPPEFQDNSYQRNSSNGSNRLVPDPPSNLHVRGVEDGCLVLAWKPPALDNKGCNKGFQVKGYMVYIDNMEYEHIPHAQYCQVVVANLDPSTSHRLAVQSLCAGGHMSPRAELVFEGMVRWGGGGGGESGQPLEDGQGGPLDTDLSSVLNSIHYTKGTKKKVMALYEYNPEHQSPHDYTPYELAFHAGDIIAVYGEPRPDGFYHGEIEGQRGLIPACFVEDLSTSLRRGKGSEDSGQESSKA